MIASASFIYLDWTQISKPVRSTNAASLYIISSFVPCLFSEHIILIVKKELCNGSSVISLSDCLFLLLLLSESNMRLGSDVNISKVYKSVH